jgi:hypothetical protein
MRYVQIQSEPPAAISRRGVLALLPAGVAGCLGCAGAALAQASGQLESHSWTEKADLTWEQVFRFAYQKDLIPLLSALAEQVGREEFVRMIREASDAVVKRKTAGRQPVVRDLATLASNLKNPPPIIDHAIKAEILQDTPEAFEYRVSKCLWAKTFRDENAGDIGYAMVCYPDYPVARGLNPKLKLIRNKTLMQGDDCCVLRYAMETA